jgi:dihydroxyacid dehydratase/phosphogluconate dehydratase
VGKVRDGDLIEIVIDRERLCGTVHLVGEGEDVFEAEEGARRLALREPRDDLAAHPALPDDTKLWAALVQASGGVWGGCVYDTGKIVEALKGK